MSEDNEWKDKLSERDLSEIAGGEGDSTVIPCYRCETCGATWNKLSSKGGFVPRCCGKLMTFDHWALV